MAGTKTYEIDLASLGDGTIEKRYEIDGSFFRNMDNEDILDSEVIVILEIEKRHGNYMLHFDCTGIMDLPCDRCLGALRHEVDATYDITIRYGELYDDSKDEVLVLPYSTTRIDVAPMIYDTLLLTIPMRCVHPEGECDASMEASLRAHSSHLAEEEE